MIIGLFPNLSKKGALELAKEMASFLQNKGITVVSSAEKAKILGLADISSFPSSDISFLCSLGGDGSVLHLLHSYPHLQAPVLAVNLGKLGFLAEVSKEEVFDCLNKILSGDYRIEERLMMEGLTQTKSCLAVNEIVLHRANNPHLVDISIHVDGVYLNTFASDGLIISTPSGSTAYSLAAGGPILSPDLEALVLTPISPHTLSNRPFVFCPQKEIRLTYLGEDSTANFACDGESQGFLSPQESLLISPSKRRFRLITFDHHDYFHTLRHKLGWSGHFHTERVSS